METRILMLCQYYTMAAQFYSIDGSPALQFSKYTHVVSADVRKMVSFVR